MGMEYISGAYWDSYYLSFRYQTSEQQEKIDTFINKVEQEYVAYCEQKRIEEQKAYELKITSGVQFVGMSENDINITSLGVSGEIYDEDDENLTELEEAGLDPEELEFMDDDERREILEAAGLDPDDFDF